MLDIMRVGKQALPGTDDVFAGILGVKKRYGCV
jgi:hypothetical protein